MGRGEEKCRRKDWEDRSKLKGGGGGNFHLTFLDFNRRYVTELQCLQSFSRVSPIYVILGIGLKSVVSIKD